MSIHGNVNAFLAMLRACEGTAGEDGYCAMFGYPMEGRTFDDMSDHPRRKFPFNQTDGKVNYTTAAGAYQFIVRTWDRLKAKLDLEDFSADSQDEAAIELIREAGALADVKAGNLHAAIEKCSPIWASLPASKYLQPKRSFEFARDAYLRAGGALM